MSDQNEGIITPRTNVARGTVPPEQAANFETVPASEINVGDEVMWPTSNVPHAIDSIFDSDRGVEGMATRRFRAPGMAWTLSAVAEVKRKKVPS